MKRIICLGLLITFASHQLSVAQDAKAPERTGEYNVDKKPAPPERTGEYNVEKKPATPKQTGEYTTEKVTQGQTGSSQPQPITDQGSQGTSGGGVSVDPPDVTPRPAPLDYDNDGYPDYVEEHYGTNPRSGASYPDVTPETARSTVKYKTYTDAVDGGYNKHWYSSTAANVYYGGGIRGFMSRVGNRSGRIVRGTGRAVRKTGSGIKSGAKSTVNFAKTSWKEHPYLTAGAGVAVVGVGVAGGGGGGGGGSDSGSSEGSSGGTSTATGSDARYVGTANYTLANQWSSDYSGSESITITVKPDGTITWNGATTSLRGSSFSGTIPASLLGGDSGSVSVSGTVTDSKITGTFSGSGTFVIQGTITGTFNANRV